MNSPTNVFKEIAVSLSGGGYRAASFHLGTLEMLDRLGLLSEVTVLSTVSGGTITGAVYAASLTEGLSFKDFYDKLYLFLRDRNVVKIALENLPNSVSINGAEAMPSLIRAAAGVYSADDLLGDKTMSYLLSDAQSPLREIAFNATDFRSGNSFRFQKSDNPKVYSGNNFAAVSAEINSLIRLADIVAASSCFPSGFEPIRFPSDFVWLGKHALPEVRQRLGGKFIKDLPLMDGGVFDNQGIDSIENIYQRKSGEIGLYIISDTSQRNHDLLDFPPKTKTGRLSLGTLYVGILVLLICSIITLVTIVSEFAASLKNDQLTIMRGVFLYLIPFLFSAGVIALGLLLRHHAIRMQKLLFEKTGIKLWQYVRRLTLPEVIVLADARLKSVISMTSSVFMKRIRALGFDRTFANPGLHDKLLPNLIYDLDNKSLWGDEIIRLNLQPSDRLRKIAREAEAFETNLWFLDSKSLDNLIECGQATMCFKLLKHLLKYKSAEINLPAAPEAKLYEKTRLIWDSLNETDR